MSKIFLSTFPVKAIKPFLSNWILLLDFNWIILSIRIFPGPESKLIVSLFLCRYVKLDMPPILRKTKGVSNFVRFGLIFAQVPDTVIEFIKTNEIITAKKIKTIESFKNGDKVQIKDGVFKNCIAIFKTYKSEQRVILLLNILGQTQSINIKKETLIRL